MGRPVEVVKSERKIFHVSDGVKVLQFNVIQVIPVIINNHTVDKILDRIYEQNDEVQSEEQQAHPVWLTEVLQPGDPRTRNSLAASAVKKELYRLFEQQLFEEVHEKDVPHDAVILPSKMVYAIKNTGTNEEVYKAWVVAGGQLDRMKRLIIHNSMNFRHGSIRLTVSTTEIKKWNLWFKDAVQAYIQAEKITRYVALLPAPEFDPRPHIFLRLLKFLYGLSESCDACFTKLKRLLMMVFKMIMMASHQALYIFPLKLTFKPPTAIPKRVQWADEKPATNVNDNHRQQGNGDEPYNRPGA